MIEKFVVKSKARSMENVIDEIQIKNYLRNLEPSLIEEIRSNSALFHEKKINSRQWLSLVVPSLGDQNSILKFLSLLSLGGINWSDYDFLSEYRNKTCSKIDSPMKKTNVVKKSKKRKREAPAQTKQKKRHVTLKRKCPLNWEEDESLMLVEYVQKNKNGAPNWKDCARVLAKKFHKERTASQCSQHWNRVANPRIEKGPWKKQEDNKLLELYDLHNGSWSKIAKAFGNRPDTQCKRRYEKLTLRDPNFVE